MERILNEHEAYIALNMAVGWGPMTVSRLVGALGSARAVAEAGERDLVAAGIPPERAMSLRAALDEVDAASEIARADQRKVDLVTRADPGYPRLLAEIADPPLVLYVRGSVEALGMRGVAIVGTRHATTYGRETAHRFGYQLAASGFAVVSGLARGIDTEAHRGAVQAKGVTIGVLGGALDRFFPRENIELAASIVQGGGAVVSEFPFGREPDKTTFPMRNRIVSGLSRGVVAVEAPPKSGTLITTAQALEQDRVVMAVPGPVDSASSAGCNQLIRAGARLVASADDVIEELDDLFADAKSRPGPSERGRAVQGRASRPPAAPSAGTDARGGAPLASLQPDERKIYEALEAGPAHVDALVRATGLPAGKIGALVTCMQIKHLAKMLPGGLVSRAR